MSNFSRQLNDLTPTQKLIGNILFFVGVFWFVIFEVLAYFVLDYSMVGMVFGGFFGACSFIFLTVGFLQINTVLMWMGWFFSTISFLFFAVHVGGIELYRWYPIVFCAIPVASILTLIFSVDKKLHLWVVVIFGTLSGLFFLGSFNVIGYAWMTLIVILYMAVVVVLVARSLRVVKKVVAKLSIV